MKATFAVGKYFVFPALILCSHGLKGQSFVAFKIDTISIYLNRNLDNFLSCIKRDHFQPHNDKKAIPVFIAEQLDFLTGGFSLANPKEEYQCCCTSDRTLPKRKLEFLSMSKNILVMTYLTGGIGVEEHILFIKFEDKKITDVWYGVDLQFMHSLGEISKYLSRKNHLEYLHINMDL